MSTRALAAPEWAQPVPLLLQTQLLLQAAQAAQAALPRLPGTLQLSLLPLLPLGHWAQLWVQRAQHSASQPPLLSGPPAVLPPRAGRAAGRQQTQTGAAPTATPCSAGSRPQQSAGVRAEQGSGRVQGKGTKASVQQRRTCKAGWKQTSVTHQAHQTAPDNSMQLNNQGIMRLTSQHVGSCCAKAATRAASSCCPSCCCHAAAPSSKGLPRDREVSAAQRPVTCAGVRCAGQQRHGAVKLCGGWRTVVMHSGCHTPTSLPAAFGLGSTEQTTQPDAAHLQARHNSAISCQLGAANALEAVGVVKANSHKRARQDAGAQDRWRSCHMLVACRSVQ